MKTYITGPSGSGKTTFARKLSEEHGVPFYSLDYVFFDFVPGSKKRIELAEKEWRKKLSVIFQERDWIVEGSYLVDDIFENAEEIIYLRSSILKSFFRQWKRYFQDPVQRIEHGFINNLKLSITLFRQYFSKDDLPTFNGRRKFQVKSIEKILEKHTNKVVKRIYYSN